MFNVGVASFWHVHAEGYAREVNASGRARITLVWDEHPERGEAAAKALGVPFEPDYATFLERVDGIILTAPTARHTELLLAAADARRPVFSEKLLTLATADARRVVDRFHAQDTVLTLSLPRLTNPFIRTIEKWVREGTLGTVTAVRTRASHDGAFRDWLPAWFYDLEETGGGALIDLGAHPVYVANRLLGAPERVTASFRQVLPGRAVEDNAAAIVEYADGAIAEVESSFVNAPHPYLSVEVHGTTGTLYFGTPAEEIWLGRAGGEFSRVAPEAASIPGPVGQWLDAVLEGRPSVIEDEDMIHLTQVMEAAVKSANNGRMVAVEP